MPLSYVHFAFTAGELSPALHSRADLEKFDLGLRKAKNWLVDYTGGVVVRPGMKFLNYIKGDKVRFVPFTFNLTEENSYLLLFHPGFIRIVQGDGYLLETAKTVEDVVNNTLTITAHGYSVGDWLWLGFDMFEVISIPSVNEISVAFVGPGTGPDLSAAVSAQRVYTIPGPDWSIVQGANFDQYRDDLWICSAEAAPQKLTRKDHLDWQLSTPTFAPSLTGPGRPNVTPNFVNNYSGAYAISAVDETGREAPLSAIAAKTGLADIVGSTNYNVLTWNAVAGASGYNVYRSILTRDNANASAGMMLGWQSFERGTKFVDQNVVPDFQKQPRIAYNPFATGAIREIVVTSGGSGYDTNTTVSITSSTGSGFVGEPIVEDGKIVGVFILNPGENYDSTADTITFTVGSGATATFQTSPASNVFPSSTAVFNSRRIFAGTKEIPVGIFASRLGAHEDFSRAQQISDNDPFELLLDGPELAPIRHLIATPFGLLAATDGGIYQITASDGAGLTASNAIARSLERSGAHNIPLLTIEDAVIYLRARGNNVQMLRRGPQNTIQSQDISVFSRHLFGAENLINSWAWALIPQRQLWAVRQDGRMNVCSLLPSQNVYAWTRAETQGKVIDCAAIRLQNEDAMFFAVKRSGKLYLEKLDPRTIYSIDDAFGLDSFLALSETPGTGSLKIENNIATSSAGDFANTSVGDQIRWRGWRWTVTAVDAPSQVTLSEDLTGADLPADQTLEAGEWTVSTPTASIEGLWHLEGETIQIFADGEDFGTATVSNGKVDLLKPAGRVIIGLPYEAELETLPVKALKNQRGRAIEVVSRIIGVNAVEVQGQGGDWQKAAFARGDARQYTRPKFGQIVQKHLVLARWDEDAGVSLRRQNSYRFSILGIEIKMESPQG